MPEALLDLGFLLGDDFLAGSFLLGLREFFFFCINWPYHGQLGYATG